MEKPKLFISYSRSAPEHIKRVYNLASALINSGVDVKFDIRETTNNHDSYLYLDKMINDSEVSKILIVSDKGYVEKVKSYNNGNFGKPDIISAETFNTHPQNKFFAVTFEKDADGKPYLPYYYNSGNYVEFCEESYDQNFKNLLDWVFDKPFSTDGKVPPSLTKNYNNLICNREYLDKISEEIKNNKTKGSESFKEYLRLFSENLESIRIKKPYNEIDDAVIDSINAFLPYRNLYLQLLSTIAKYAPNEENVNILHKFLESLLPYMSKPADASKSGKWESDHYIFLVHELFLYTLTSFIINELFNQANSLLEQKFYIKNAISNMDEYRNFSVFRKYMKSLDYRNTRLQLRNVSLRAELLKDRCSGIDIEFSQLMQTDFILFMRAELLLGKSWWPETLFYMGDYGNRFDLFLKISSKKYFNKVKNLLGIYSYEELKKFIREINNNVPEWGFLN